MRNYIVASWNDADQYDYSGQQIGNRLSKSQRVHFNPNGSACVASYGDDEPTTRKTSISIQDRILPQAKRLRLLTDQLIELEQTYKSGGMSIESYSMYRAVLVQKRNRATVLYNKAVNVSEPSYEDDEFYQEPSTQSYTSTQMPHCSVQNTPQNDVSSQDIPLWLSSISDENTFKNKLIKACKGWRKAVQLSQAVRNYINELKDL